MMSLVELKDASGNVVVHVNPDFVVALEPLVTDGVLLGYRVVVHATGVEQSGNNIHYSATAESCEPLLPRARRVEMCSQWLFDDDAKVYRTCNRHAAVNCFGRVWCGPCFDAEGKSGNPLRRAPLVCTRDGCTLPATVERGMGRWFCEAHAASDTYGRLER